MTDKNIIRIKNPHMLKHIFTVCKELFQDAVIKVDNDAINIEAMDSSHISMTSIRIHRDDCDIFQILEPFKIGVNLETLLRIVKVVSGKDDVFTMTYENNKDTVDMSIDSSQSNDGTKKASYNFSMRLMDISNDELEIPELNWSFKAIFSSKNFKSDISTLVEFGEDLHIECTTENMLKMFVKAEQANCERILPIENDSMEESSAFVQRFSSKFVKTFSGADKVSEKVHIHLSEEIPMNLLYPFGKSSHMSFYLAPRIDD